MKFLIKKPGDAGFFYYHKSLTIISILNLILVLHISILSGKRCIPVSFWNNRFYFHPDITLINQCWIE
jgi:hypothetical protein